MSQSKNLFSLSSNPFLYLSIALNSLPVVDHRRIRRLNLSSPIYGPEFGSKFLFIVSNEFKKKHGPFLKNFEPLWKFVKYDKLRDNFTEYKDKKALLKAFDLFFCERKIAPLLKTHLGTHFYEKHKFPFPVELPETDSLEE